MAACRSVSVHKFCGHHGNMLNTSIDYYDKTDTYIYLHILRAINLIMGQNSYRDRMMVEGGARNDVIHYGYQPY